MGKGATVVLVAGVFVILFAMLYFASNSIKNDENMNNSTVTNATLQNAILIAEGLNEAREFKKNFGDFDIQTQAVYLTENRTKIFRQQQGQSFLPEDKPTILVTYGVKLDVENSAILRVFIDPETNVVYGTYEYATQFG